MSAYGQPTDDWEPSVCPMHGEAVNCSRLYGCSLMYPAPYLGRHRGYHPPFGAGLDGLSRHVGRHRAA